MLALESGLARGQDPSLHRRTIVDWTIGAKMSRREEALDYLARVSQLLGEYQVEGIEAPTHDHVAIGMFARSASLLIAGAILVERHHAEEALALGRALFTESLNLMTLDDAGDRRAAYALRWSMDSLTSQVKLVYNGAKDGAWTTEQADEMLAAIKRQQQDVKDYQRRHGVPKLLGFGSEREMAERFGRTAELHAFLISHHMVHGSDLAHSFRRELDLESASYRFAMESHDDGMDAAVAAFLGRSALYSCRAACHIFGWREPQAFDELIAEAERLERPGPDEAPSTS